MLKATAYLFLMLWATDVLAVVNDKFEEQEEVPFVRLIVAPDSYNGKLVRLIGYLRADYRYMWSDEEFEMMCGVVMYDEATTRSVRVGEMVRFCIPNDPSRNFRDLHGYYVGVVGRFYTGSNCAPDMHVYARQSVLGCLKEVKRLYISEVLDLDEQMPQ